MQKQKHIFFTVIFFLIFGQTLFSQNTNDLPNGYANIQLGMSVEETKEQLLKNSDFGYHGDRDVSLVPEKNQVLIETDADKGLGSNFLTTSYFQFHNDQLYVITINLNKEKIDQLNSLKEQLKAAIEKEDFENAATLRDQIRSFESGK